MTSIQEATEAVIKTDLRLYDTVKMDIINYKALARTIQADVEAVAGVKATINAIAIAAQRFRNKIIEEEVEGPTEIFGESRLQLRDDIHLLYMKEKPETLKPGEGFMVLIQGMHEVTIIADEDKVKHIDKKKAVKHLKNLSVIIITSPSEIVETPGVIAHLITAVGGRKINLVEIISSGDTTYLLVDEKDSLRSVEAIRSLIKRAKTTK